MPGPVQGDNAVARAVNTAAADGDISRSELRDLKRQASAGTIPLVQINQALATVAGDDSAQGRAANEALTAMRGVAVPVATAQSDALTTTLGVIDTLNPFAYARWAFGGTKPGCGTTW